MKWNLTNINSRIVYWIDLRTLLAKFCETVLWDRGESLHITVHIKQCFSNWVLRNPRVSHRGSKKWKCIKAEEIYQQSLICMYKLKFVCQHATLIIQYVLDLFITVNTTIGYNGFITTCFDSHESSSGYIQNLSVLAVSLLRSYQCKASHHFTLTSKLRNQKL
jgi:hypothetical protein